MRHLTRIAVSCQAALILALSAGCALLNRGPDGERFARYVPAGGGMAPSMAGWAAPTIAEQAPGTNPAPAAADGERRLRTGDRVVILLRGITPPAEIAVEIDDTGSVNLEHIGQVVIAGLTSSEAARRIETAFIKGQYYNKISVTIVPERDEYYVSGEVRNPGKFALPRGLTLTMAIAAAGGYTDYANPSKVRIIRGREAVRVDAAMAEKRQIPDPLIQRGDTIIVDARVL
jgi:polysaccharide export outer membrane protein